MSLSVAAWRSAGPVGGVLSSMLRQGESNNEWVGAATGDVRESHEMARRGIDTCVLAGFQAEPENKMSFNGEMDSSKNVKLLSTLFKS